MRNLRHWIFAVGLVLPLGAAAQTDEALVGCGQTELLHSNTSIKFLGADPQNAEAGDRRILYWSLSDLDGRFVGTFDVVSTVLGGSAEFGHYVQADGVIAAPSGELFVTEVVYLGDATDTGRSGEDQQIIELIVTGGTGDFSGASGTVSITVPESQSDHLRDRPMLLDIRC
ncbi:hypothetical protein [Ruegeria jejuensis]|uniref:hypothetical protein n=1 Tax=Ruegeria jejuensis TaxID=3233338 RepID=UPI00355B8B6D